MSASTHGGTPYYYVPAESRHPVLAAAGLFFVILGAAQWINGHDWGKYSLALGLVWWLFVLYQWFRDAARESEGGLYGHKIDLSYRWSMSGFIFSEVVFFGAFFTAMWWARAHSVPALGSLENAMLWPDFKAVWPSIAAGATGSPAGIVEPFQTVGPFWLPTINTALLSTAQNKERICDLFLKNGGAKSAMRLTIMSFGFKFGLPPEADLVLDVRCLPNPFYVPGLKHKTGLDQEVVDFVMSHPEAKQLLERYELFLQVALPLYVREGKSQLTIAVGCTGGKHRSITFARKIAEYCTSLGYEPGVQHRDAMR